MKAEFIKFAPAFTGLTDEDREVLAAGFEEGKLPANTQLVKAGEPADAMYMVGQGFVSLTTPTGQSIATLGPGSLIGDTGLFRADKYDVTAQSLSELEYWQLSDTKLRSLILEHPQIGLKLSQNFGSLLAQMSDYLVQRLSRTTELGSLPPHTLQAMATKLRPEKASAGQELFRAGDAPVGIYLLELGEIELTPEDGVEDRRVLKPGAVFDALPLLAGKSYSYDAIATEPSLLWLLPMENFQQVSAQFPALRRGLARSARARLGRSDQAHAVNLLAQVPIFEEIPSHALQDVAARLVLRHVPAGERVYMMGDLGDGLYLVENGEIELTAENASGVLEELARVGPNGYFGERGLGLGQIRSEDATAVRNSNVWVLPKNEVDRLADQYPSVRSAISQQIVPVTPVVVEEDLDDDRFRQFALFSDLGANELAAVIACLQPNRYREGEQIYRSTSPADMLFLLEDGHVRIQTLSGGSWVLGPGDTFGERALLTNQPHNASAVAETDANVWTLSKEDFDSLMNQYPTLAISLSRLLSQRLAEMNGGEESRGQGGYGARSGAQQQDPYAREQRYAPPSQGEGELYDEAYDQEAYGAQGYGAGQGGQPYAQQGQPYAPQGQAPYDDYEEEDEAAYVPAAQVGGGAPSMPSRRRYQGATVETHGRPGPQGQRPANRNAQRRGGGGIGAWFSNMTTFGKVRLAILVLLLIWLLGIVAPYVIFTMIRGTSSTSDNTELAAAGSNNILRAINAVYAMGSYELAQNDSRLAQTLAMADQQIAPTPTYTPPPTQTPVPTNTPLPTPTPTPLPTATPTQVPVVQQAAPAPVVAQAAAPAPQPEPEPEVQAASMPGRTWDPRLDMLGVRVDEAGASPGQSYFRLVEAIWQDEQESGGRHHIFVEVLDEGGNRIVNHPVTVFWGDGSYTGNTEDKNPPDYAFNYMMYAAGNAYNVKVEGAPSDVLIGAGMGDIENPRWGIHTSVLLTFQKVTR